MAGLLKMSEAVSLGLHAAALLADHDDGPCTTRRLAGRLEASEAHLAKVMQRLAKAGLVASTRGPRGGFVLAAPADEITLLEVYEAIEGPVEPTGCLFGAPVCGGKACIFGGVLSEVETRLRNFLAGTRLSDLRPALARQKESTHAGA